MVNVDAICHPIISHSHLHVLNVTLGQRHRERKGNEKITRYHLARINERITKTNESTEQANIQFINDGHDIVKLI